MKNPTSNSYVFAFHVVAWMTSALSILLYLRLLFGDNAAKWFDRNHFLSSLLGTVKPLTAWNHFAQHFYLTICLVLPSLSIPTRLKWNNFIDGIFALNITTSAGVTLLFWGLCAINTNLVIPPGIDLFHGWMLFLNLEQHLGVILIMVFDLFLQEHIFKPRRDIAYIATFALSYVVWIMLLRYVIVGSWLYPFLALVSFTQFLLFSLVCFGLLLGLYTLFRVLNSYIWKHKWKLLKRI